MTEDLIQWLRAQLDDDERVARAVEGIRKPYYFDFIDDAARPFVELTVDPARVLAEVDAKRQRLAVIERDLADDPTDETAQYLLRLDLLPYAARPGYRDEWKP